MLGLLFMIVPIKREDINRGLYYLYNSSIGFITIYTRNLNNTLDFARVIEIEKDNKVIYISDFKFIERLEIV